MSSEEQLSGERLVPDRQYGELVHAEHLARYLLAAQLAAGRTVLDVASGEGYGTALLAKSQAVSATGVDVDERTVKAATERYPCAFHCADIADLPFEDDSFDLVVSFETIEHVSDAPAAFSELARVLAPDGLLMISTPNTHEYLVDNEFHTREFSHEEFVDLLRARFGSVRLMYQHNWLTSAILDADGFREAGGSAALDLDVRKTAAREPGRELYTVALCGQDTEVALRQVAVTAGTDEAHSLAKRLVECEATARTWHAEYEKAEDTAQLWHDTYKQEEARAAEAWAHVHAMQESLSWRLTRAFRAPAKLWERRGR